MKKVLIALLTAAIFCGVFYISPEYIEKKTYKTLDYYVKTDDTVKVFGYNGKEAEVTIPEKIDGMKVSAVSDNSVGFEEENGKKVPITDFVVNGYPNSAAQVYAEKSGLLFNCLHRYTEEIEKAATYSKTGSAKYTCSCGYQYTEKIGKLQIPKINLKSATADGIGVCLEWDKIENLNHYEVYRKIGNGEFSSLATLGDETTYTDTTAESGAENSYYVIGKAGNNKGDDNAKVLTVDYLKAPVFQLATVDSGVQLKWNECPAVDGYIIYKMNASGEWENIQKITDSSVEEFIDTNVNKKSEYTYTMKSFTNEGKNSAYIAAGKKIIYGEDAKVVYLTFDDGPSDNTLKILRILRKYGAKGTFFVTANGKTEYMKTIVDNGSQIALHTYSHDYKKIYSSVDAYMEDLNKIHDLVYDETGVDSRVIRFPGGASNTISESYSKGIMTKLTRLVEDNGFHYFDWNVSSGDADGDGVAPSTLLRNIRRDTGGQNTCVVLMHDTMAKSTTVTALPDICEYYSSQGYEFEVLTPDSPVCHQQVNN